MSILIKITFSQCDFLRTIVIFELTWYTLSFKRNCFIYFPSFNSTANSNKLFFLCQVQYMSMEKSFNALYRNLRFFKYIYIYVVIQYPHMLLNINKRLSSVVLL